MIFPGSQASPDLLMLQQPIPSSGETAIQMAQVAIPRQRLRAAVACCSFPGEGLSNVQDYDAYIDMNV